MTVATELEVRTIAERGVFLSTGDRWHGLRVRYRVVGSRRWTSILLIPDEDQTLVDLEQLAMPAAERHHAQVLAAARSEAST